MRPNFGRVDERMLQRMVQGMISRGTIESVEDATEMQLLNLALHDGHAPTKVEHWQPYGMSYLPKTGAEVLAMAIGGNRDLMATIPGADPRYRMKNMAAGELAVHDDQGQFVHFKRGGILVMSDKRIDVGGLGGSRVMTEDGPARNLYAVT